MIIEQAAAAGHLSDVSATQMWTAVAIFIATYGVVLTERINRAIVAVLGAGLMVLLGVMTQEQAVHSVDANTIGLLLGMMILVAVMKESGVFQYVAIKSAKVVKAEPIKMLVVFAVVTAVFSALLDNVTTVLLTTPVILLITRELNVKPYPYLFTSILASNIGGAATLIGDPPNIMIGSAAHLGFSDF
ncbi:MAG: SLC13 family permease, partial [Alphaproteobacteria bacterium]|nr:SLC13 family permease [Alphaproteobacteria bacterium]